MFTRGVFGNGMRRWKVKLQHVTSPHPKGLPYMTSTQGRKGVKKIWHRQYTEWSIILRKQELREQRRQRGNAHSDARTAWRFSRTSWLRNLHYWVNFLRTKGVWGIKSKQIVDVIYESAQKTIMIFGPTFLSSPLSSVYTPSVQSSESLG